MAFKAYFFKFQKRTNSTAQPILQAAEFESNITLNDSCSVVNPVLILDANITAVENIYSCNYCYIPEFSRYYYIDDWTFSIGVWAALCHVDVLSSYRDTILSQPLYVLRSTYDNNGNILYDPNVSDATYGTTADQATYQSSAIENPFAYADGVYVVGIINKESSNGAVTYYAFNTIGFKYFCRQLFTYQPNGWLGIDTSEISEGLQKALVNPFQYVVSCQYLPINVSDVTALGGEGVTSILFGWYEVNLPVGARKIDTTFRVRKTSMLSIPRHPLTVFRGNYLNIAPYAVYTLRYYPFGTINIDSEAIASWNTLDCYVDLDLCTGKGILNIAVNGFNNPIRTIEAQVGVNVPTAALQTNFFNIATPQVAGGVAGAALIGQLGNMGGTVENPVSPGLNMDKVKNFFGTLSETWSKMKSDFTGSISTIKQEASNIFNTAVAATTTAEITGFQGNASAFTNQTLTLSGRFLPVVSEDFSHTGRPLMKTRILSTLSGFCLCKDADFGIPGTDREKQAVKAFLEGGVYIE